MRSSFNSPHPYRVDQSGFDLAYPYSVTEFVFATQS